MKYVAICKDENGKVTRIPFEAAAGEIPAAVGKRVFSQTYDPFLRMSPPNRRRARIQLPEFLRVEKEQ